MFGKWRSLINHQKNSMAIVWQSIFIILIITAQTSFAQQLTALNDSNIRQAIEAWNNEPERAVATYGRIEHWDVSNVTDMSRLFDGATTFDSDLSNWDVSRVTSLAFCFTQATAFQGNGLSQWNTASLVNMDGIFSFATSFNGDISSWKVDNLQSMDYAFRHATSFNANISKWNTSSLKHMAFAFQMATSFDQDLSSWNIMDVEDMEGAFSNARSFHQQLCWNIGNNTLADHLFCESQGSLDESCADDYVYENMDLRCSPKNGYEYDTAGSQSSTTSSGTGNGSPTKDTFDDSVSDTASPPSEGTDHRGYHPQETATVAPPLSSSASTGSELSASSSTGEDLKALKYTAIIFASLAIILVVVLSPLVTWKVWKQKKENEDACTVVDTASLAEQEEERGTSWV
mgnify:CR=1 FL=1